MIEEHVLGCQVILDGLSQAVLIFDGDGRLVADNAAARSLRRAGKKLIRAEGWRAAAVLFDSRAPEPVDSIRARAGASLTPVRFHVYRSGEYIPASMTLLRAETGEAYLMLALDAPDWTALSEMVEGYLDEVREVVSATRGHVELIEQTIQRAKAGEPIEKLGKRVGGFTRVIQNHMYRLGRLTQMMERLGHVRTGRLRELVSAEQQRVILSDFFEDLLETFGDGGVIDPESDAGNPRRRVQLAIPGKLSVTASPLHLTLVLRDILRNAIMYSSKSTPVNVIAYPHSRDNSVQIDVIDEGVGIRTSEVERVFEPFLRSRQPRIIGEFGYGLGLYLCKHEVETMNGRIWFESEEGAGTTFSIRLPGWIDANSSSES